MNFSIKVKSLLTGNQDSLQNIVKKIEFDVVAEQDGHTYTVPSEKNIELTDTNDFVQFEDLTEQKVVEWLEKDVELITQRKNIAAVGLQKYIDSLSLTRKELPWSTE